MLIPLKNQFKVLVTVSSESMSNCNQFHVRQTNSGKITTSLLRGYPYLMFPFAGLGPYLNLRGRDLDR